MISYLQIMWTLRTVCVERFEIYTNIRNFYATDPSFKSVKVMKQDLRETYPVTDMSTRIVSGIMFLAY